MKRETTTDQLRRQHTYFLLISWKNVQVTEYIKTLHLKNITLYIEGDLECDLADLLVFVSGSSRVPPTGFHRTPVIEFQHDHSAILPTASTCEISIHIPTCITDYQLFKDNMVLALKGNDGFGIV